MIKKYIRKFARYIRRTYKNKICAMGLILLGLSSARVSGDATAFVFGLLIGVPLFFCRKNYIIGFQEEMSP